MTTQLTLKDRCDKCGAAAKSRAFILTLEENQPELFFCGHHLNENKEKLLDTGWTINDGSQTSFTYKIIKIPQIDLNVNPGFEITYDELDNFDHNEEGESK